MLIPCKILRDFPYGLDGLTLQHAKAGQVLDMPGDCVPGLIAEGYVSVSPAPIEAKVIAAAPETGGAVEIDDPPAIPTADGSAFDHDGDGKPGGSLPKALRGNAKTNLKPAAKPAA
jgi:hypothetical protein